MRGNGIVWMKRCRGQFRGSSSGNRGRQRGDTSGTLG
jgi:hypothetical protein